MPELGRRTVSVELMPTLVQTRRRLAAELLSAAARHSAVVDEIHDLEEARDKRPLSLIEEERYASLREERALARRRHDHAARDLRRLMSGARLY
jgi:hypothetical protein